MFGESQDISRYPDGIAIPSSLEVNTNKLVIFSKLIGSVKWQWFDQQIDLGP